MMHPDHRVEGEKCSGCGRPWLHREGDGGKDGPISCYHKMNCPVHPSVAAPTSTQERQEWERIS